MKEIGVSYRSHIKEMWWLSLEMWWLKGDVVAHLEMWWLTGSAPVTSGADDGFESGISHNDPDALQDKLAL